MSIVKRAEHENDLKPLDTRPHDRSDVNSVPAGRGASVPVRDNRRQGQKSIFQWCARDAAGPTVLADRSISTGETWLMGAD